LKKFWSQEIETLKNSVFESVDEAAGQIALKVIERYQLPHTPELQGFIELVLTTDPVIVEQLSRQLQIKSS
jgi:hypothetical protein